MPAHLWLASGVRAIDHCVEGLCSVKCHEEAASHFEKGLTCLLKGLVQYHAGLEKSDDGSNKDDKREELLKGISECQLGSRETLLPWIKWHVSFGASHAIGHQLVCLSLKDSGLNANRVVLGLGKCCGVQHCKFFSLPLSRTHSDLIYRSNGMKPITYYEWLSD